MRYKGKYNYNKTSIIIIIIIIIIITDDIQCAGAELLDLVRQDAKKIAPHVFLVVVIFIIIVVVVVVIFLNNYILNCY